MPLDIHTIVSMPFAENTYVVWRPPQREALVIDPGLEPDLILDFLNEQGLTPAAILNTHGHADHIGGNAAMKQAFPQAPLLIGVNDAPLLTDADANLSAPFGLPITSPPADRLLREGETIDFAGIPLEVIDLPGHSPGHIIFLHRDQPPHPTLSPGGEGGVRGPCLIFGGDVLFRGGIGRYDFPGSDGRLLLSGIRTKLFALPSDTVVYPGHGPTTTIGQEKRTNPFVGESE